MNRLYSGFALIFWFAAIASTTAAILLSQQSEIAITPKPIVLKQIILGPLRDKNFRKFFSFITFWYLTSGIASPFIWSLS